MLGFADHAFFFEKTGSYRKRALVITECALLSNAKILKNIFINYNCNLFSTFISLEFIGLTSKMHSIH